jgi:hypothetical protein
VVSQEIEFAGQPAGGLEEGFVSERAMPLYLGQPRLIYLPLEAVTVELLEGNLQSAGIAHAAQVHYAI